MCKRVVEALDASLDGMVKRPLMYGQTLETLEVLFLCVLEFRQIALGVPETCMSFLWGEYLQTQGFQVGNGPLFAYLTTKRRYGAERARTVLIEQMQGFRAFLVGRQRDPTCTDHLGTDAFFGGEVAKRRVSPEEYERIYEEREAELDRLPGGAQGAHPDMSDLDGEYDAF